MNLAPKHMAMSLGWSDPHEGAHPAIESRLVRIVREGDESPIIGIVGAAHADPSG